MGFARCHDLFDRSDLAILNLEDAVKKATDQKTASIISKELIEIYKKMAQKFDLSAKSFDEDVRTALDYYEKCLVVCQKAKESVTEGQIAHKIGQIYFKHKMYQKSIEHQNKYLKLASNIEGDVALVYTA